MIIRLTYRKKWYADIHVSSETEANTIMMKLWQEGKLIDTQWDVLEKKYESINRRKIQKTNIEAAVLY